MRPTHFIIALAVLFVFLQQDIRLTTVVNSLNPVWVGFGALLIAGIILGQIMRPVMDLTGSGLGLALAALIAIAGLVVFEYKRELGSLDLFLFADVATPSDPVALERKAELKLSWDGHFRGVAQINGRAVSALIDTGASTVLLRHRDAKRIGLDVAKLQFDTAVTTAAGRSSVAMVVLDRVRIGTVEARDVTAAIAQPGQLQSNLLGMSFLRSITETVIRGDRMYLQQ